MIRVDHHNARFQKKATMQLFAVLAICGFGYFAYLIANNLPQQAWPTYLINVLLWSAIAQGGMLFSMIMHVTKARWSHPLSGLSEAFAAFFPFSFSYDFPY